MNIENLKKKKEKKNYTQVRVETKLYREVAQVAKKEKLSIIKMVEFLLESALENYNKLKSKKISHKRQLDYKLILNYVKIHESMINDVLEDNRQKKVVKKSLEEFKKHLNEHIVKTIDDVEQIEIK